VDITRLIIKVNAPNLLAHLDFDEEGYLLDMYTDSEEALQEFIASICPVYQNLNRLEGYTKLVANHN